MYTIIDSSTKRVLFAKFDDEVLKGQDAINELCTLDNPEGKDVYFNEITREFYIA